MVTAKIPNSQLQNLSPTVCHQDGYVQFFYTVYGHNSFPHTIHHRNYQDRQKRRVDVNKRKSRTDYFSKKGKDIMRRDFSQCNQMTERYVRLRERSHINGHN